jgi:hypothetical protein
LAGKTASLYSSTSQEQNNLFIWSLYATLY